MSFMSINPSNGIITISASSSSSNFTHKVTAKVTLPSINDVQQDFILYDLRLYFAELKDSTMLSGDIMANKTTWYNSQHQLSNPLTYGTVVTVNGTTLPATSFFIQHDSVNKIIRLAPTSISHFGVHTLRFVVTATPSVFYEHVVQVSVRNRAPYFVTNITNANYSTTFKNVTTFLLPIRVSPDQGTTWARIISDQDFVTTVGQGTDLLMRVNALNFYDDIKQHNVSLEVFIPNYPNTTKYWINLRIVNTPPKFDTPLVDYDMGLYQNKNFKLPKVIDPDGGPVSVRWGIVTNFNFIKFEPTTATFMFNPMEVNMIGDYNIMVTLTDYHDGTYSEEFTLRVHRPPMFATQMKKYFTMKVGSMFQIELPLYETHGVDTYHSLLPGSFVKFDEFQYIFKPTTIAHLGVFLIKGRLQNTWGSLDFDFRIEVTNDPPALAMKPKDFVILQDTNFTQALPVAIDPEGQSITFKMTEAGQNSLPSFINFDKIANEYTLAPTKRTKIGIFIIQIDVIDIMNSMNTYKFKIQVLENNLFNKNKIKDKTINTEPSSKFKRYQAKLLINQVRRDGTATLKISSGNSMTGQLAIQVTNLTFSIRLVRGDQVRYEVESVDEDRGTVEIQLMFASPSNASNKMEQDKLEVQVIQRLEFENDQMHLELKTGQIQQKFVPPQLSSGQNVASIFSSGNIKLSDSTATNFAISMMFQTIWMQLDDTSFMSINSMISMPVPGMVQLINNVIISFIYVDIFLSDQWLPELIYGNDRVDDDNEPLNSFFDESGYSSRMLLKNINSSLVLICIYCSIFALLLLFKILGYYFQWFMLAYEKLRKKLFWSISIQFFDNQFPPLLSASLISLFDLKFENKIHKASAVMSIAILFLSAILILSMVYHLCKARKNSLLQSEDFTSRLGALTEDQRQGAFAGVYWRPLILLRWTATMLIMTFLRENFYVQIFTLLGISFVFQVMIAGSKPMLDNLDNNMLLFNEFMVSIYLYLLLCLTDFMDENDTRDFIGFALLCLVVSTVLVNLLKFLIVLDWCFPIRKIKQKWTEYKKKQAKIKEANKKLTNQDPSAEPSKNGEILKKEKRKSVLFGIKHNNEDDFTNLALQKNRINQGEEELNQTGALEFGGGNSYNIKIGSRIRQKQRQHVAKLKRDPKTNLLKVESYNESKEEVKIPQLENPDDRLEFDQAVDKMMRDLRNKPDLFVKDKKVAVKAKYNEYYDE